MMKKIFKIKIVFTIIVIIIELCLEYKIKTYAMVKAMCENEAFTDITDIYACIVNLVEHSYGYDSTEILLTDTQVVHLMAGLDEGDYDTDHDNLLDRQELDHEENVNISNLLEEYINYNRLPEEDANKLRADPYIKMWAYKSNPALPDTDFDGRNDDFDIHRPLENRQSGKMSTLNYEEVNFDYNQDYRYFAMKPDQYYYDLSEMSMILANMVNKKSGINRRWLKDTNYVNRIANDSGGIDIEEYRERYNAYSVEDYMNYIGLEDIEVRDMSSTYEDANVCRYAIGHRDVVYSLGITSNVVRNVIAISIGDIEAKAAELYANFDGHGGREGSNTEYHHIGFDIVANRILETVERYASRYDPRYQKVYWITGEAGGGSVANLLAQKMIKKYGNQNIYCYTFQALNTINCNNISAVQRISNEPYGSIFNLYNDDNQVLQIYTNEANFYMYGARRHVAVSSSKKYMDKWRRATGVNYDITPDKEYAKNFIKMLADKLDREMVSGFAFTEIQIKTIDDYIRKISETNNPKDFENLHIDLVAYFVKIGLKLEGEEFEFEDPNDNKKFKETMAEVEKWRYINFVDSSMSLAGVNGATDGMNIDIANNFGANGAGQNIDDVDPRDGYLFNAYIEPRINYGNNNHPVLKISQFMYTNYTIDERYKERDINYVKFWNRDDNGKLSEYLSGDYSKYTVFTREGKTNNLNKFINNGGASRVSKVNGIYTIDGRIVAAFPGALKGEDTSGFKGANNDMNKVSSYNSVFEWGNVRGNVQLQHDGDYYSGTGNGIYLGKSDLYKLVDCVFEDSNKYQFVVPFIIMDAKMIHLLPNYDSGVSHFLSNGTSREGMYSNFTDNRYGQVIEYIDSDNPKTYEYYAVRNLLTNKEDIISRDKYVKFDYSKYEKFNPERPVIYFDKLDTRKPISISPIEPNTEGRVSSAEIIQTITGGGMNNYRLVSMRIYKDGAKIADESGRPIDNPIWLGRKRDIETATNITLRNIAYDSILEYHQSADYYMNIVDY